MIKLLIKNPFLGPMGHLFHSIHEQNYIAHVIAYATKIGPYQNGLNNNSTGIMTSNIYLICILISFFLFLI
jgi:alkaline phosphatase